MEVKKTKNVDVYAKTPISYDAIYKEFEKRLGANHPFAKHNQGVGYHSWTDSRYQWRPYTEADSVERMMVDEAIEAERSRVVSAFGANDAAIFFTYPDESYLFYSTEGGETHVLIAGWGFNLPRRHVVGKDINDLSHKQKNPVRLSFVDDGERLVSRPFAYVVPSGQEKDLTTGSDGYYVFPSLAVGTSLPIVDRPTGGRFTLNVVDGRADYEFDITRMCKLSAKATADGAPLTGETVKFTYRGREYPATLGADGTCSVLVAFHEGETAGANLRDSHSSKSIAADGAHFDFVFNTKKKEKEKEKEEDPPEPPTLFRPHILIEGDKGFIGERYPIGVEYEGTVTEYTSDMNGIVQLPEMISGKTMRVHDRLNPGNIQDFTLDAEQEEYVFKVPYENINEPRDIKVMIRDAHDKPIPCFKVRFRQDGVERLCRYDQDGNCWLANGVFKVGQPIEVTLLEASRPVEPIKFALEEGENEYLLQERGVYPSWITLAEIGAVVVTGAVCLGLIWPLLSGFCRGVFAGLYY